MSGIVIQSKYEKNNQHVVSNSTCKSWFYQLRSFQLTIMMNKLKINNQPTQQQTTRSHVVRMLMIRLYCRGLTIAIARISEAKARLTNVAEGIHAKSTENRELQLWAIIMRNLILLTKCCNFLKDSDPRYQGSNNLAITCNAFTQDP